MASYKNFQEIPAWQLAHKAVLEIYKITQYFPKEEIYGLTAQIRRSAASVPANITEGFYRNTIKEFVNFLYNARGSSGETFYHLILAHDLKYINNQDFNKLSTMYITLGKQMTNWIKSLRKKY